MQTRRLALIPIDFALPLTIVLGACLRLLCLGQKSYWWDEVATIRICRLPFSDFRTLLWQFEANMSFYYLLVRAWIHFGDGESWLRLLSVIPSVASIPVVYAIGSRISGKTAGLTAALLLSLNVAHIAYAQEARSYALLMLLCLLSLLFFVRSMHGGVGNLITYVLVSTLAVYTHFYAVFFLCAQWMSLLSLRIGELPWKKFLIAILLTACLISPALYYIAFRRSGQLGFISRPHPHDIPQLIYFLTADGGKFRKPLAVVYLLGCAVAVRLLFSRWRNYSSSVQQLGLAASLACATLPIAVTFTISFWYPIFLQRYLLICLPPLVLLAALGLIEVRPGWIRSVACILLVWVTAGCLMWYYSHPKDDWRSLTAYLVSQSRPGDVIVGCPSGSELPVKYYGTAMNSHTPPFSYVTSAVMLQHMHDDQTNASRFWVVSWGDCRDDKAFVHGTGSQYVRVDERRFAGSASLALYATSAGSQSPDKHLRGTQR